jgi:glycosyltransferase involved in cell wall biosynthesis
VDAGFRWGVLGPQLERLYSEAVRTARRVTASAGSNARTAPPARACRALLVGVHPLPGDADLRGLSFPGHRTEQFEAALKAAGCDVQSVLLDEEPGSPPSPGARRALAPEVFRAGRELQRVHDAFEPDVVVAAGGFHAARVTAGLDTDRPRWIDLPGDLAAEGQLRAVAAGTPALADHLAVLARSLSVGDRFSVVGPSQRLALLGQLGLSGRLTPEVVGRDPVSVVPVASRGPDRPPELPAEGFRALWAGGYNTWMDAETLLDGLEKAMARHPLLTFVSMGGAVPGHSEDLHRQFWERVRASPFAGRFHDHGRLPRREAVELLASCHVVLCVSRRSLEAELGARLRVVEACAHGRPAVVTALGDLARDVAESDAGELVPAGDPDALAAALARLGGERDALARAGRRARSLWERRWTYAVATAALAAWARHPDRWPVPVVGDGSALHEDRLRLQAELDAIRSSYTFRALRLLDRVLGRGGGAR